MTEPAQPEPAGEAPAAQAASPADASPETFHAQPVWKRFYAFLLGPALLAAAILAVFTISSVLTTDDIEPQELVAGLQSGGEHRRWQSAFALTKYLQPSMQVQETQPLRESDSDYAARLQRVRVLVPELLTIWDDPHRGDPKVRRFLALAFGYLAEPRVLPALAGVLGDEDVELVHYALVAITTTADIMRHQQAAPQALGAEVAAAVIAASRRPEDDLRASAVYALAVIGGAPALARVREALSDVAPAVAWNAAFGMARQGDAAGAEIIAEILDRGPLYGAAGNQPARQRDLFLNAVRSAGMVRSPLLEERLARIAEGDPEPTARNEAIRLLEKRREERDTDNHDG